jgi:biotin carboxyl carrier protein
MTTANDLIELRAEWPGRVAEIHVGVGDRVEQDQEVLTLESMKMLTPVTAPAAGSVAEIHVEIDQFVDEGAVLVRINAG